MGKNMQLEERDYPILEFDPSPNAVIEPGRNKLDIQIPERCVMTFFGEVAKKFSELPGSRMVGTTRWENGNVQIYAMEYKGREIAFFHTWVGAPVAASLMEFVIAYGGKKFIACGGCGVLDRSIAAGQILIPTTAVRDEGTSYHYLPPSREVVLKQNGVDAIKRTLENHGLEYLECKTWTTDAFYRETLNKVALRKTEGCLSVEMECAALAAVAEFRGVDFAQMLYSGDNLDGDEYDERDWWKNLTVREKLFVLSLEACLEFN